MRESCFCISKIELVLSEDKYFCVKSCCIYVDGLTRCCILGESVN